MAAEYLVRLDDACPTLDQPRWDLVQQVLMRANVCPIAAIVPRNEDPALVRGPTNDRFWDRVRVWAHAGWMIAMHGYSHDLRSSAGGLVPVNRRSEFVGLPVHEQRRRITAGIQELQRHGLSPEAWVAPAHGMDRSTLDALRSETEIRIISDSFVLRPVLKWGFVWLPQQLWRPRAVPAGLWTVCLHPNEMNDADLARLERFVARRPNHFPHPRTVAMRAGPCGPVDTMWNAAFLSALHLKKKLVRGTS